MRVPFADLKRQHDSLRAEIETAIQSVLQTSAFIGGKDNPYCLAFEREFSDYLGGVEVIGCANGTDSIEMILKAFQIGPGDEVIVPAMSWISTSEAVGNVGATPVFVDVDPITHTMDARGLQAALSPRTKALIPVHLYGMPADMDPILEFAAKHGLRVIEDCAQSHGATYKGRVVGTIGDAASFSFYPGKNLGALGDAGAVAASDSKIAEYVRRLGNHGQLKKHEHKFEGRNSRLDGLQAAVLSVKLKHLDAWTARRRALAREYTALLANSGVVTPPVECHAFHAFHLYVVLVPDRNGLQEKLRSEGIATAIHYPAALPDLVPYASRAGQGDYPAARRLATSGLSLPLFPEMTSEMVQLVCAEIRRNVKPA